MKKKIKKKKVIKKKSKVTRRKSSKKKTHKKTTTRKRTIKKQPTKSLNETNNINTDLKKNKNSLKEIRDRIRGTTNKSKTIDIPKHVKNLSQTEVIAMYRELQLYFKQVYEDEAIKENQDNLNSLNKLKLEIVEKIEAYKTDHTKIRDLSNTIFHVTNMLNQISHIKVPSSLEKIINKNEESNQTSKEQEKTLSHSERKKERKKGKIIKKYNIKVDDAEVEVEILKSENDTSYNLYIPEIKIPTTMLLNDLRNELISITSISMKELTDPNSFKVIKSRFIAEANNLIKQKLPNIEKETEKFLIGHLIQEMLGLGRIEFLINDPTLEEIVIPSSKEPIRVYAKDFGWLETNITIKREEEIINYSNIIARRVGRQINVLSPLLDAHLVTGDRINAVLYPINTKGNTITIRKFARDPFTIIDLIDNKTCDINTASLIWLAIEYEMNVLVSGGTASGKTVFLNACMPFIPPNQRILSIEDTRELMLPDFLYWNPLVTRTPNPEGKGEVSMLNLLVNALRMRPDRIILGEMRRHEEAMVLFEAMHTGHSVYATVHADSAAETVSRLINPPMNVPANLLKAINLNVVMFRDRRKGIRRVLQVAEVEAAGNRAEANIIYRWLPEQDKIIEHSESTRFIEDITRHTGMSESEVKKDLAEKNKILAWLIKRKIRSLQEFGQVMNSFYRNKEQLMKAISKNNPSIILQKSSHSSSA